MSQLRAWLKRGFAFVACIWLVATVVACLSDAAEQRRTSLTKSRLKALGLAIHNYHEAYGMYPPSFTEGPGGKPWHSWRTLIVPFFDDPPEFEYRFDEPWNSKHNVTAARSVARRFQSADRNLKPGETNFLAPTGRRSMWQGPHSMSRREHHGGASNHLAAVVHPSNAARLFTDPHDISTHEAVLLLAPESRDSTTASRRWYLFADGTSRRLSTPIDRRLAVQLLLTTKEATPIDRWPGYLPVDVPLADDKIEVSYDATEEDSIEVVATPRERMDPARSTVWCSTFEHAWSIAEKEFGHPIRCLGALDQCQRLSAAAKEPPTLTVDDVITRIVREVKRLEVHTELFKPMPFVQFYESIDTPLEFRGSDGGTLAQSFGHTSGLPGDYDRVFEDQLKVLFYNSPQRHAVELQTDGSRRDRLLFAQLEPGSTLWETWESARLLQNDTPKSLRRMDVLQIPKFAFELKNSFRSLVGRHLTGFSSAEEWQLTAADQTLRFKLNERGADLYSHVRIEFIGDFGGLDAPPSDLPRELIYDGPFLLAATEEGRERPFLLMWVANGKLLSKANSPQLAE